MAECKDLENQLKAFAATENDDSYQTSYKQLERKIEKCHKRLEKLLAKLSKEEETGKEKQIELEANIHQKTSEMENLEKSLMETVRDESRLQALIEEQYFRLDMRRKAFMDAIRLSSRNIFYCLMGIFRPLYNNYRDDHVILRELTQAMGIIEKRDGVINIQLLPAMEFQPKVKQKGFRVSGTNDQPDQPPFCREILAGADPAPERSERIVWRRQQELVRVNVFCPVI